LAVEVIPLFEYFFKRCGLLQVHRNGIRELTAPHINDTEFLRQPLFLEPRVEPIPEILCTGAHASHVDECLE